MRRNIRNKKKNFKKQKIVKHLTLSLTVLIVFLVIVLISVIAYVKLTGSPKDFSEVSTQTNGDAINSANEEKNENETKEAESSKDITFNLASIGDVLCHNTQYWDAYNSATGEYDFSYVYDDINYYTKIPDITIGSLETSFAGEDRGYSNYPTFNSPDALAYGLKKIGLDVISTAGNHCLDMGFSGLSRTIDVLEDADISHLGTYKTQEDQDKVLFKYVKGVKIAFINYTYGTNGIPVSSDKVFCVNLIDKDLIAKHIQSAKDQNADMIVACMHWGTEYRLTSNSEQEELADFLFQSGVNVILGNHPHVLEPMEKRTVTLADGTSRDGFVIYAQGNFTADQRDEITRDSIILNLSITKHADNSITIDKVNYTPIYMYKNPSLSIKKMKIIDIEKTIASYEDGTDTSIGQSLYNTLTTQLQKIKSIVGEEIN